RVRWQLDGWLTGRSGDVRPTAGISVLRLIPEEIVEYGGLQLGLWGDVGESDERAHRVLARVQGMLGPAAVLTAVLGGGRGPDDRVRFVPWRDERTPERPDAPWPGRLPSPSPAEILTEPVPAVVLAADGSAVGVTGRAEVTAAPASVSVQGGPRRAIRAWAGPWPVEERWWDPPAARRRARFQVLADDPAAGQVALLLSVANGSWWAEAIYG
ncbi:MAG: protein ImuB, partial [Cryptosporangiaceae bacterium]|nr:protein ImuB [Cryptosporangiaceae bacterium]